MMLKTKIVDCLKKAVGGKIKFEVFVPENEKFGHYSTSVALRLAKLQRKKPMEIAEDITKKLKTKNLKLFEKIEVVAPGFINFWLAPKVFQNEIREILKKRDKYGGSNIEKNKVVIIDYSSPNIAKPMHVGHLRSTIIGQAIFNLYKFLGYKVISDNHLGDWGTQFGIMIAACKKYKSEISNLKNIPVNKMLDIYVKFNQEIKNNPELHDIAKYEFKKLEAGDKENRKIWKILREKSLKEFDKIYKILGIKFDLVSGESLYEKYLAEEIETALKKGVAVKNLDNSVIINLEKFNLPPCLIQKSDGATLYETRDLATIRYRIKKYKPDKIIYVVGNEQSLHFEQLFYSAELLGYISHDKLRHVKFGLILGENRKKLATREGRFIIAEDLINKIIELAEKTINEKNPLLSEKTKKKVAKTIGIGALKYNDLSQNRQTDIVFNWNKMMSFRGNSAPYLLYTYVRLKSILRKTELSGKFKLEFLKKEAELKIARKLINFPDIVENSANNFQINNLADFLYLLACSVNNFYENYPILKAEKNIRLARLALIKATAVVLKNGLNLLGIKTLERM